MPRPDREYLKHGFTTGACAAAAAKAAAEVLIKQRTIDSVGIAKSNMASIV